MSIDEIFSSLSSRMIRNIMYHEQLMNSYLYLGLYGYAKCHEYHYLDETKGYISLCRYKIDHYHTLINVDRIRPDSFVPNEWVEMDRDAVDISTRKDCLSGGLREWIEWEEQTKELYESVYKELLSMNEIDAAEFIKTYILDVEEELVYAKTERLHKRSMDYDIVSILEEQKEYEKEFTKKIGKLW